MFVKLFNLYKYELLAGFIFSANIFFLRTYIEYLRIIIIRTIVRQLNYGNYLYYNIRYMFYRRILIHTSYLWMGNYRYLVSYMKGRGSRMGKGRGNSFIQYVYFNQNRSSLIIRRINRYLMQFFCYNLYKISIYYLSGIRSLYYNILF